MPRTSAAALAVMPPKPAPYPEPPAELTERQADIWRTIVTSRPPEYFDGACWAILVCYCRAVDAANVIADMIENADPEDNRYGRLLSLEARQTRLISSLSAKLRLAPQHVRRVEQVVPKSVGRPWEPIE